MLEARRVKSREGCKQCKRRKVGSLGPWVVFDVEADISRLNVILAFRHANNAASKI